MSPVPLNPYQRQLRWRANHPEAWRAAQAKCQRRATRKLTPSYVRTLLRQMGIREITTLLIKLETARLHAIRVAGTYQKKK